MTERLTINNQTLEQKLAVSREYMLSADALKTGFIPFAAFTKVVRIFNLPISQKLIV